MIVRSWQRLLLKIRSSLLMRHAQRRSRLQLVILSIRLANPSLLLLLCRLTKMSALTCRIMRGSALVLRCSGSRVRLVGLRLSVALRVCQRRTCLNRRWRLIRRLTPGHLQRKLRGRSSRLSRCPAVKGLPLRLHQRHPPLSARLTAPPSRQHARRSMCSMSCRI